MSYIPLNGEKVIEKANGALERRQTPATVLRDALASANEGPQMARMVLSRAVPRNELPTHPKAMGIPVRLNAPIRY